MFKENPKKKQQEEKKNTAREAFKDNFSSQQAPKSGTNQHN